MPKFTVLWLQSGGCGGCTMSLLCAENPGLTTRLEQSGIELLWHPSLSEASADEAIRLLQALLARQRRLDALCLEGSLLRGPNGTGRYHVFAGTGRPMVEWVAELAAVARYVLAVGNCAAFGGIPTAGPNPTDACGLQYEGRHSGGLLGTGYRSGAGLPVINVAGCPPHPDWILDTLQLLASNEFATPDLDEFSRPAMYTEQLAHQGCPRNEFYEYKASAVELSELGCLMEHLGCAGTQARADCNNRLWNGEGSCTRAGYACINCTAPEFEEPGHAFLETPNIAGIPISLPTDMPKAWFIVLSSLAKAATPTRIKRNARADRILVRPGRHTKRD